MPKIRKKDKPVVLPLCHGCKHLDDFRCVNPNRWKMVAVIDADLFPTSRYSHPLRPDTSRVVACTGFTL